MSDSNLNDIVTHRSTNATSSQYSEEDKASRKSHSSSSKKKYSSALNLVNPFKMPPDSDIFLLRDKEKQKKLKEKLRQRELKVHEKTTYTSRICFRPASMIQPPETDSEDEEDADKTVAVKDDPQFTIAITRDRHVEKESLSEYIAKKREMFLVQYSLGVKRDEMRKLEEIAQAEEKKLELAEQYLEEDAAMFDEFLKENDKNSVEAIKIAETEAKLKMEKVNEIKRINAQMMAIKSEISKYEDTLKEYQLYSNFLESLIPTDIQEARIKENKKLDEMEETALNMNDIEDSDETGETETKTLKEQIDRLQAEIQKEEAKAADLKIKAKMFNYGEFKADDDQEQRLAELNKKVEEVYRSCIGDNEANISTLQMLTNIENRLEELFETIETMPQDKVEAAEKAKDKERRQKMREEKLELLRLHQEERVKKALERAQAEPKKKTGKRLVFRSEPPMLKKKEDEGADQTSKEEEELMYYFSW
uniref:DUF4200 domain-containing protein n=1 Tax=Biomphalaria glabrata TaxID=6526 RepID=A0A2C9KZP0_BIOGL